MAAIMIKNQTIEIEEADLDVRDLFGRHEVDEAHVAELAESIARDGWQGAPILVDGYVVLDGHHRHAAVKMLREQGVAIDAPVVDVSTVAAMFGVDWAEEMAECLDDVELALSALPADVRSALDLWI